MRYIALAFWLGLSVVLSPASAQSINNVPWAQSQYVGTIASGQSLSGIIDLGSQRPFTILVPSGWTAANITFQSSVDGINFEELYDSGGNEVTVTVGASPPYLIQFLTPGQFLGTRYLIIRSGTAAAPVNQTSSVQLTITGQ